MKIILVRDGVVQGQLEFGDPDIRFSPQATDAGQLGQVTELLGNAVIYIDADTQEIINSPERHWLEHLAPSEWPYFGRQAQP